MESDETSKSRHSTTCSNKGVCGNVFRYLDPDCHVRKRWNLVNLEETNCMLRCTSKALLRRGEVTAGKLPSNGVQHSQLLAGGPPFHLPVSAYETVFESLRGSELPGRESL